jgi:actin-related protein
MSTRVADLDFYIGDEATKKRAGYNITYPIKEGVVESWDNMEKYWQRCIFHYMRFDPEEHYVMLVKFLTTQPDFCVTLLPSLTVFFSFLFCCCC